MGTDTSSNTELEKTYAKVLEPLFFFFYIWVILENAAKPEKAKLWEGKRETMFCCFYLNSWINSNPLINSNIPLLFIFLSYMNKKFALCLREFSLGYCKLWLKWFLIKILIIYIFIFSFFSTSKWYWELEEKHDRNGCWANMEVIPVKRKAERMEPWKFRFKIQSPSLLILCWDPLNLISLLVTSDKCNYVGMWQKTQ